MRCRTILAVTGVAMCVALQAGCTTTSEGQPLPQGTATSETTTMESSETAPPHSTTASNSELPSDGAPKVKYPLDTSRFQQEPCKMLTSAQLQELNLPAQGEPGRGPLGSACNWFNRDTGGGVNTQWGDKNLRGLSGVYAARDAGRYAYFIELPEIESFPAVASDRSDARDTGTCIVTVGVTDQLTFQVGIGISLRNIGQKDPCEVAAQVAGMMLRTMKAGG